MEFSIDKSSRTKIKPYSQKQKDWAEKFVYTYHMRILFGIPLLIILFTICFFKPKENDAWILLLFPIAFMLLYFLISNWFKNNIIDDNVNDLYLESIARSQ